MPFSNAADYFFGGYHETYRGIFGFLDRCSSAGRIRRRQVGALARS
jgi:hypothetical protein